MFQALDRLGQKVRKIDLPGQHDTNAALRICVNDIYKSRELGGVTISGKVESGAVTKGDTLICRPSGAPDDTAVVKGVTVGGTSAVAAVAGDTVELGLGGVEEAFAVLGAVLCHNVRLHASALLLPS